MRRRISLLATLSFVSILALIDYGCSSSSSNTAIKDDFKPDLNDPKLKEHLAADDGYSVGILYGADIHGSLETCG